MTTLLKPTYKNATKRSNSTTCNHSIPLQHFIPQGIYFSNNDSYIVVVGKTELKIIETKMGKVIFKMKLPTW